MRLFHICVVLLLTVGCTPFPQLQGSIPKGAETADYPDLVPLDPLLANIKPKSPDAEQTANTLNARASGLQARANKLRALPPLP